MTITCNPLSSTRHRRSESWNKHCASIRNLNQSAAANFNNTNHYYYYEEDCRMFAIEQAINQMDQMFDATFGSWIRDPLNLPQALPHLLRIAKEYHWSCLISILNYLTVDWPIHHIIQLLNSLTHVHKKHYPNILGTWMLQANFEMEWQVQILQGLQCDKYFDERDWRAFLEEGWDFGSAASLLSHLFPCTEAKILLKNLYS